MKKRFTKEGLSEAISFLQPVTPTDADYPAHWYNEGYGQQIYNHQKMYLDDLKQRLSQAKSKVTIQEILLEKKELKPIPEVKTNEEVKFWSEGFGLILFNEYNYMIMKFVEQINSLEGIEF